MPLRIALALLTLALQSGCVERSFVIRSTPDNARVILHGEEVGQTPYTAKFLHYGLNEVTLSAPEHRRLRTSFDLRPPWYERFPLDFVSECLWPFTLHDRQVFHFTLEPITGLEEMTEQQKDELLDQAGRLRQRTQDLGAVP